VDINITPLDQKRERASKQATEIWCNTPSHRYFCTAAELVAKFFEKISDGFVQ